VAVVSVGALVAVVGCTAQATQSTLSTDQWSIGDASPIGGTTLAASGMWIRQSGHDRDATVVAPTDVAEGERLPVVIVLPGLGYTSNDAMNGENWLPQLDARHLIGVFPDGIGEAWNAGSCCKPANVTTVDDVGFLTSLITQVEQRDDVDSSRIYMVGFSNGGMMMYRFLCTHGDMLAGGASVAGPSVAHCLPSASIPLIHVAGTADAVVPLGGGFSQAWLTFGVGQVPSTLAAMNDLVTNDGCWPTPFVNGPASDVSIERWQGCENGAVHELAILLGGAHVWPVGGDFDATTEILDFFGLTTSGTPPTTTTTTTSTTTTTTTEDPTTTSSTEDPTTTTSTEDPTTTVP
jgi:polyhydroxybutyrate depolymerase